MRDMAPTLLRRRLRAFLILVLAALIMGGVTLWATLLADLPPVSSLEERMVRPTTRILDRNGRLLYEVLDNNAGKQISHSPAQFPTTCIQATLATEDKRFYSHPGVDVIAIGRALYQNFRARGDIVSGGSTITQQVARNLLLEADERYVQTVSRKLREAWLAVQIEWRYTKDEILAIYLNQTYYGNFAFGLEAAAQIFFAKPASQLSRGECALLAGLVQYPTGYNPLIDPEVAKARQLTVLRLMREAGYADEATAKAIAAEPLRYKSRLFDIEAPHFVMYVQDLLTQRFGADRLRDGGLTVTTTLDLTLQQAAEKAITYRLDLLNCRTPGLCTPDTDPNRRVENAAAVILDSRSGDILAMVGSPDYFDASIQGNVNAALALRQPGSAIKPLTYAAALDPERSAAAGVRPLTPGTILADLPTTFLVTDDAGGTLPYVPLNYDRRAHGPVSVRDALANSYNIPAVKVLERIGVGSLKRIAADSGITSFTSDFGLALTLGGGEVRLLELTSAFGILDDGRRLDPRAILAVDDRPAAPPPPGREVISPQAAWLVTDILDDDLARIPAFGGGAPLTLPFPTAVKTGTTTDWRDNWTIGYTTERIVGVWVGNADNTPMRDVSGVDGAGPIWRDLMLAAHRVEPAPFARPAGIVDAEICAPSGLLATPLCPRTRIEHYIDGSRPKLKDNQFQQLALDRATGLRATPATPAERVARRVYWMLPPEYHGWMLDQGIAIAPPATQTDAAALRPDAAAPPAAAQAGELVLAAPSPNTAFQLHPGLPQENQRFEVAGYAAGGAPWHELRLVAIHEGEATILATAQEAVRLSTWWVIEPGTWRFVFEGTRTAGGVTERSPEALVVVEQLQSAALTTSN